jgi:hypothetical protein
MLVNEAVVRRSFPDVWSGVRLGIHRRPDRRLREIPDRLKGAFPTRLAGIPYL